MLLFFLLQARIANPLSLVSLGNLPPRPWGTPPKE